MTRLRVVGPDETPTAPATCVAGDAQSKTREVAPHPPTACIQCGAPARVTVDNREPTGLHRTYLLCTNKHGMAVHWGEGA